MGEKWPTQAFLECSGSTLASHKGRIPCTSSRPISSAIDFCLASFLDDINAGVDSHCLLPRNKQITHSSPPQAQPWGLQILWQKILILLLSIYQRFAAKAPPPLVRT